MNGTSGLSVRLVAHLIGLVAVAVWCSLTITACTYPSHGNTQARYEDTVEQDPSDGVGYNTPQMRIGSMPFNTLYSPFEPLGPDDLGDHTYLPRHATGLRENETSRGTLYTRRGGFLDIAHIRNSADLTRFCYEHILHTVEQDSAMVRLMSAEPDIFLVHLNQFINLTSEQQREAAPLVAARVAYLMTTWHEIATWFGYQGMVVVTEKPSAFSYDDAPSHMVGVNVAAEALQDHPDLNAFDQAFTRLLRDRLKALDAVPADEVKVIMRQVEGRWWSGLNPKKRLVHMGLEDESLTPLVIDPDPTTWVFRADASVAEHRIGDLYDVYIHTRLLESERIRDAIGIETDLPLHPRTHLPPLRDELRRQEAP